MRWSLRFWPDTRSLVDDVIGFAPTNHGTATASTAQCAQLGCRPADFEQAFDSEFIRALNSTTETFPGISYTNIYSRFDELATPARDADHCTSCLTVGPGEIANIQTQELCPLDVSDHVLIGISPATYALVLDALTHDGPAVLSRVPRSSCNRLVMPGVTDPASAKAVVPSLRAAVGTLAILPGPLPNPVVSAPVLKAEPELPCYVYATCEPNVPEAKTAPAPTAQPETDDVDDADAAADVTVDTSEDAPLLAGVLGTATNRLRGQRH